MTAFALQKRGLSFFGVECGGGGGGGPDETLMGDPEKLNILYISHLAQ